MDTIRTALPRASIPRGTLIALGALSAFGPLSLDMYLPALPSLARDLHTTSSVVQLTLSLFLIGLGVGQLLIGPISDAFGRRRPLLAGLAAYIVVSAICAAAPSILPLLVMRFIQGMAGACGIAIARAVVRDRAAGNAAARAYAALMVVAGLGPIVAPVAGGLLLHVTIWRGLFVVMAAIGVIVLAASAALVPESLPRERRDRSGITGVLAAFGILLRDRRYLGHTLCGALAFGSLMSYVAASPFVLERIHGLTAQEFSAVFASNGAGILIARQAAIRRLAHSSTEATLAAAVSCQALAAIGLLATVVFGLGLAPLLIFLFLAAASFGAANPMAAAAAMEDHPERAGSASGILGFLQFAAGSIVAPLVGVAGPTSALPLAIAMPACAVLALFALQIAARSAVAHSA